MRDALFLWGFSTPNPTIVVKYHLGMKIRGIILPLHYEKTNLYSFGGRCLALCKHW